MKTIVMLAAMLVSTSALAGPIVMDGFGCDAQDDVKLIYEAVTSVQHLSVSGALMIISSLHKNGVSCWYAHEMTVTDDDVVVGMFVNDRGDSIDVVRYSRIGGGAPIYSWAPSKGKGT
jgi:hypothetical protein